MALDKKHNDEKFLVRAVRDVELAAAVELELARS